MDQAELGTTQNKNQVTRGGLLYLLWFLLICSVTLNVLLAKRIGTLKGIEGSEATQSSFQPGEILPPLEAKTVDGTPVTFQYEGSGLPTIVYVFSPKCGWCDRNRQSVEALQAKVDGRYRFIAVSVISEGLAEYLRNNKLSFPVYTDLPEKILKSYKMETTPQTIILSSEGEVLEAWQGAYVGPLKHRAESFFGIELPEITP